MGTATVTGPERLEYSRKISGLHPVAISKAIFPGKLSKFPQGPSTGDPTLPLYKENVS